MDNSSVIVLRFQFQPERDSPQEQFFKEDYVNKTEQEKSRSTVSQAVEEWCKCGKCEPMLTGRECRVVIEQLQEIVISEVDPRTLLRLNWRSLL